MQMVEEIRKKNSRINSWEEPQENYKKFQRNLKKFSTKKKIKKDLEIFQILNWEKQKVQNNSKKNSRRESLKFSTIWREHLDTRCPDQLSIISTIGQVEWTANMKRTRVHVSVITCSKRVKASGARDPRA